MEEQKKVIGVKEAPKYNYNQHVGKKVVIAETTLEKGDFGYYILVSTVPLDEFKGTEGDNVEIRATKILGLIEDEKTGDLYFGEGYKGDKFLKSMGITDGDHEALIGKEVLVQKVVKGEREFLTIEKA